jgi:hypothetical protein
MKFKPRHDRVLVRRVESDEKTTGGLIIPDSAKEKPQEGEVVTCGEGALGGRQAHPRSGDYAHGAGDLRSGRSRRNGLICRHVPLPSPNRSLCGTETCLRSTSKGQGG